MSSSTVSDFTNDSWIQWQQLQDSKNDRLLSPEQQDLQSNSHGLTPLSASKSEHESNLRTSSLKAATVSRRKSIREMVQRFHSNSSSGSSETNKTMHGRKSSLAAHQRRKSLVSAFDSILGRKHVQHAVDELTVPVAPIRSSSIHSSGGESTSPMRSLRSKKSAESISSSSSCTTNTGLRRHVSSGGSLATPSASQSLGYYKPALRNYKLASSPSLDKMSPHSSDLISTVSAAQSWLKQQPAGPMNKENIRRRQSAQDAEIKKRGNSLRPKAKSMRSANESVSEQQMREIQPTPSTSFTRTTTRSRSRVFKSPPPPPVDTIVDEPPSLPNVDVKQIKDQIDTPRVVPRPPRTSSKPNVSSDNQRKSGHTDQNLTANIISNVKRRLSLSKERKPKELEDRTSLPANFTSSRKKVISFGGSSRSNVSSAASNHPLPPVPSLKSARDYLSDSDLSAAVYDAAADQYIPPVPPVPKHHSHLSTASEKKQSKHDSSSRASSASISGDESGLSKKTIRRKISRGSSLADTEDNDLSRWSGGSDDLMESIMKETSLFVPSPQGITPKKETLPTSGSREKDDSKKPASGNRRRGRTLPGSLATPPPIPSMPLPPMKVGPINMTIPDKSMRKAPQKSPLSYTAITPTRLPIPKSKNSYSAASTPAMVSGTSSEEEMIPSDGKLKKKKRATIEQRGSSHHVKSGTSTLTPPTSPKIKAKHISSDIQEPLPTRHASLNPKLPSSLQQQQQHSPSDNARSRKTSTGAPGSLARAASFYTPSRKAIDASSEHENPEKARKRTLSLHDKLQSMVAKHAIDEDYQPGGLVAAAKADHSTHTSPPKKAPEAGTATTTTTTTRAPKGPQTILKFYAQYLTPYEHNEVQEYEHIYFMGPHAKKVPAVPDKPALNYGYDDERGDYHIVMHDHLAYRYEILQLLGQGSFGQVLKCIDHKTGQTVAVKLIRNKRRFHAQAMTEVNILQKLVDWDPEDKYHNIRMTDYFYFRGHLCVVFECLSMNLYEFIKSNHFQGFSLNLIRRFTIQILRSLCLLYEHRVIHCDLKPENILLKHPTKSTIKVIDFGSSCLENERVYTYIQSRFYRAPEVILGMSYGMAIDMWSLGCILAELYTGVPIFPGESEQEQLACIMEILGVPDRYLIEQSTRKKLFFDSSGKPRILANSKGRKRYPGTKSLPHALRCHDAWFIDFIEKCLRWDPERRMRPHEALRHEWITQVNSSSSSTSTTSSSHRHKLKSMNPNNMRTSTGFENNSKHAAAMLVDEYYYSAGGNNENASKSAH